MLEKLQGLPLPSSLLESEILPSRIEQYLPSDLDALASAGDVVWVGVETIGERDGRIALYLTDQLARLYRPPLIDVSKLPAKEAQLYDALKQRGATFFGDLVAAVGGGFPAETLEALSAMPSQLVSGRSLLRSAFFTSCCVMVEPPCCTAPSDTFWKSARSTAWTLTPL